MAVDFSLLPREERPADKPPSRWLWTAIFVAMLLAGVFAVLVFWPKNLPTHTAQFWLTLALFPVGIPAFITLRRYGLHEGRKRDTELHNAAIMAFNERVFQAATIPLALIGAAHRFSAKTDENAVNNIRIGSVKLKHQISPAAKEDTVKARWLVTPGMPALPHGIEDDRRRQRHLTQWLVGELLDELSSCMQPLPARVPLVIHLAIANALTHQENAQLLWEGWHARALRRADLADPTETSPDLMMLDTWLDETLRQASLHARLVIAIQLQPVLVKTPESGSAEAGVAVLLMPQAMARRHATPVKAMVHRPVRAARSQPDNALAHALQWAKVDASDIPSGWQSQLKTDKADPWLEAANKQRLAARMFDLDQTVGHAGIAAPWLAMACAAASLAPGIATQLILAVRDEHLDSAVLKQPATPHTPTPPRRESSHLPTS